MTKYAKLSTTAKAYNVHYRTILNWYHKGSISSITTPSGATHYELPPSSPTVSHTIGYIRVSSYAQKANLVTQRELLQFQYPHATIVSEVASGLNFKRNKLWNIMELAFTGNVQCLVVTHKDRLARFGFEFITKVLGRFDCTVVVLNQTCTSPEQELVHDILSIIHVFSSRLYGLRKYSKELKTLQNDPERSSKISDTVVDEVL